jgi:hypothetical protein
MTDNINREITEDTKGVNFIDTDVQGKQIAGLLDAHAKRLSMRTLKQLEIGRARLGTTSSYRQHWLNFRCYHYRRCIDASVWTTASQ